MSVINTNVMSLNSQRNLQANSASLATTIQRLSSGLRINSARDDAAGLAISERFSTQIRGLNVAARNANDGISLAQTAEGAMAEIGNNLQRIRELAVQSSNATNSQSDRDALNAEVTQLKSEIQRVATQTEFNGTKLLDGNFSGQAFQVGANAGQLITVDSIANAQTDTLGSTSLASGTITIGVATSAAADMTLQDVTVNGVNIGTFTVAANSGTAAEMQTAMRDAVVSAINARSTELGVIVEADDSVAGQINLTGIKDRSAAPTYSSTETNTADVTIAAAAVAAQTTEDVDVSSFAKAQQAIAIMDSALTAVNSGRADMGAVQNRFQSVIANLSTTSENLAASRSRIRDTDYAKETAELTRTQILAQAGTAMLAQANQATQNVLSLLR